MRKNHKKPFLVFLSSFLIVSCANVNIPSSGNSGESEMPESSSKVEKPEVTFKEISKEEYLNKTLAGLLGQFAGFLSGYEFVWRGGEPYVGMPESWFDFINGPYAGNFEHYYPVDAYRYDRLRVNPDTGKNEVYSDDDYHLDIFNQTILDEYGSSSYAVKEAWKKYGVSDWGGGVDAMRLINQSDMLAPFTGTIEAGNRYGWCTEAYIENETLGMNAPGMPALALSLTDAFASNVGYFDAVVWAKFYATMYSLAYFETDIVEVMEKAKEVMPKGSHPRQFYDLAFKEYDANKNDYAKAANALAEARLPLYRIDNIQTDPNVNGGFAILSWLYGKNEYLATCKYASIMGYDGDCTGAICAGVMGILKGFKKGNEEYEKLNSMIYYDGEGVYFNDDGSMYEGDVYTPRITSGDYPTRQKIDDIVDLYRKNFEKLLLQNGGEIKETTYRIPTTEVPTDSSLLFTNYDAEERSIDGFESSGGKLEVLLEGEKEDTHSGFAGFKFTNQKEGKAYHTFSNLKPGKKYRLSAYVKGLTSNVQGSLFACDTEGGNEQEITFQTNELINKPLVFEANKTTMQVGVRFASNALEGAAISFDDFMLEEIAGDMYLANDAAMKIVSGNFVKTVKKPEAVKEGEEAILTIKYRNYSGKSVANVLRNGKQFGGVVLSKTSASSTSGYDILRIPYVFEKGSDVVKLEFDGKLYLSDFSIEEKVPYMFR